VFETVRRREAWNSPGQPRRGNHRQRLSLFHELSLVVAPAVSQLARWLGYTPLPERPFRPQPVTIPFDPSPFYGSVMTYKGSDSIIPNRTTIDDYNAVSVSGRGAIAVCRMTS